MWLCQFVFGDCLPLSLALHHLPTTINRATTTPIFAQQRHISTEPVDLITHPKHHSSIWGGGLNSLLNTQGRAHNRIMPKVSRRNPRADSSDEESPQKNHRGAPPPRSLLPPPLWEQRQRQRRPQRAPIPKHPQPQPLSQHHKRDKDGEDRKAWMSGECASWITMGVIFLC